MEEKIYNALNEIFQDIFDDDEIVVEASTTSDDIEDWDSLEHINLVVAIEKRFGLKFSMVEVNGMKDVGEMVEIIKEVKKVINIPVGIHAHNNQQLAFANTIECVGDGVDFLDATYMAMGRGAGNCAMENLLGFLKNPKYNIYPALKFVEENIVKLREEGLVWGYDIPYLMTGLLNQHPRTAIQFIKENRTDYCNYYNELYN